MNTQEILFSLLRLAVCGDGGSEELKTACTPEALAEVCRVTDRHDLTHLIGQAASKLGLPDCEAVAAAKQTAMYALMRYMRLDYDCETAYKVLQQAQIPFLPLKGAVMRSLYPEAWMRTSCDVDILVKPEQLEQAANVLADAGFAVGERTDHDIQVRTPSGCTLELHFDTIQERYDETGGSRQVLARIWEDATSRTPDSCHKVMSDAMFYFYHMAHMAKHFSVGGCGIRSVLDVWLLCRIPHDAAARQALLQEGGMEKYARGMEALSRYWFDGEAPDAMTRAVSDYILRGTLYGDSENRAAVGQARSGGKFKYLLTQRIFMPYEYLKDEYPVLKTHKWLTPVYQPVRWARMLLSGGLGRTVRELKANAGNADTATAGQILDHLGL